MPILSPATTKSLSLHVTLTSCVSKSTDLCCRLEILGLDLAASQRDDDLRGQVRAQGSHCRATQ
jgi:hypothetical protein